MSNFLDKFIEGDRSMYVHIPVNDGEPRVAIYAGSIKSWLPPHDGEPVTDEDRARILGNICKKFECSKVTYEVVE